MSEEYEPWNADPDEWDALVLLVSDAAGVSPQTAETVMRGLSFRPGDPVSEAWGRQEFRTAKRFASHVLGAREPHV